MKSAGLAESWHVEEEKLVARIDEIAGIDPKEATKLRKAGIRTTEALLKHAGTRVGREQLAAEVGLDVDELLHWAQRADMMRVRGVGSEYALLLEACGVQTIRDLRRRNPTALTAKLSDQNGRKVDGSSPSHRGHGDRLDRVGGHRRASSKELEENQAGKELACLQLGPRSTGP